MYITNATFYTGKPGDQIVIPAGEEITAKDLGVDEDACKRYVEIGTLVVKPKAAKAEKPSTGSDKT